MRGGNKTKLRGIEYRSAHEARFAEMLHKAKIKFKYETEAYEVLAGFIFKGKKVRPITYTPDFILERAIVEVKGWIGNDPSFPLREKLFKKYCLDNNIDKDYIRLSKVHEMQDFVNKYENGI